MLIKNVNKSIGLALTALRVVGFWLPAGLNREEGIIYRCYGLFWFMFVLGSYIVSQTIEMYFVWGNLPLMTAVLFILLTNSVQAIKTINIMYRRRTVQAMVEDFDVALRAADTDEAKAIVKRSDGETKMHMFIFGSVTILTILLWAMSADQGNLPARAWYPFDVTKSPAYEICYVYQIVALYICAFLNISIDCCVTSLMAQCRCRLQLLGLSLRTLCRGISITERLLTRQEEVEVKVRLRVCVQQHCDILQAVRKLQDCFSFPTFLQFNVSLLIICVTAFQLVSATSNPARLLPMGGYLYGMMLEVYMYCYQGSQISEESLDLADAAYECPWYVLSAPLRRSLLIVMTRTRRAAKFVAGGFTTLSLSCFMAILKTSYSMFTLLQGLESEN